MSNFQNGPLLICLNEAKTSMNPLLRVQWLLSGREQMLSDLVVSFGLGMVGMELSQEAGRYEGHRETMLTKGLGWNPESSPNPPPGTRDSAPATLRGHFFPFSLKCKKSHTLIVTSQDAGVHT